MAALKAVLFDLDNTLLDWRNFTTDWRTKEMRHVALVYEFVQANGAELNAPVDIVQAHFNRAVRDTWAAARVTLRAPHIGSLLMQTLTHFGLRPNQALSMNACMEAYAWSATDDVSVFADVPPLLHLLRQHHIEIGIVTNAHRPSTMRDLELHHYDLLSHFPSPHTRITAADVGYLKPHPFIFRHALTALGTTAEETVFVGDNLVADIQGAQAVGMKAILRIIDPEARLSQAIQPNASLHDFTELPSILDDWYPGWR